MDPPALLRIEFHDIFSQVSQIQKIIGVLFAAGRAEAESLGLRPRPVHIRIISGFDPVRHRGKKSVCAVDQGICLAQIHCGQCHIGVEKLRSVLFIIFSVRLDDRADDSPGVICLIQCAQEAVIPSSAGLQFLRTHQIMRVILPETRALNGAHQAGVKPHKIQLPVPRKHGLIHCVPQFFEKKAVIIKQLVASVTPEGTCAVIPQDKPVMTGREIICTIIYELCQRTCRTHVRSLRSLRRHFQFFAVLHIDDAVAGVGDVTCPPLAAAGINKKVVPGEIQTRSDHLVHIVRRCAVTALQIRADDIDHHCEVLIR